MSTPRNDAFIPSQTTRSSNLTGAPDTRLRGRRLVLARAVWVALVALTLLIFIASIPDFDAQLQTFCRVTFCTPGQLTLDTARILHDLGLTPGLYAHLNVALIVATTVVWFAVAAIIFWRRSDDWLALLVSIMLVTGFLGTNALGSTASAWSLPIQYLHALSLIDLFLVFSLFPNGRFVPRWMRWVVLGWIALNGLTLFLPNDPSALPSWFGILLLVLLVGFFLSLTVAQIYRYRYVSIPRERQQTKWIVYSLAVVVVVFFGWYIPFVIVPSMSSSVYTLISTPVFTVASVLIPLSFGIAILRYRLWDIDIIIRRTLVYSTLIVVLAVIYQVSVFTLQSFTSGITFIRGNQLAIVASTFLIGGLFKPLYDRVRALIDRRFYRRKYDAAKTVAAFSVTIRDEVDLNQLRERLLAVVEETMQPAHVSLWLCPPKRYTEKTTRALPFIETVG
jgi:hypothetical protein